MNLEVEKKTIKVATNIAGVSFIAKTTSGRNAANIAVTVGSGFDYLFNRDEVEQTIKFYQKVRREMF